MATVLVLDDERSVRSTFTQLLDTDGHDVVSAETAGEALAILEQGGDIDVVIADIFLPDMSGALLLDVLASRWPETKVILITGEPSLDVAMRAVRSGAHDFLHKPISAAVLCNAVASAVRLRSLEKASHNL